MASIREEFQGAKLSKDGKLLMAAISKTVEKLTEEFAANLQQKDCQIIKQQSEVNNLNNKAAKLKKQADHEDAYKRMDTVFFHVISLLHPMVKKCTQIVFDLVKAKAEVEFFSIQCYRHL